MQAIFHDRIDTFTGVRGGMGPPSEELPSETPPGGHSLNGGIYIDEPCIDAILYLDEPFDDALIHAGPAETLRNTEILGPWLPA